MKKTYFAMHGFGLLLLVIAFANGCTGVDQRRLASLRDLHLSNKEMEQHVRAALHAAAADLLQEPRLLIAHRGVFNREGGTSTSILVDEVNIVWMEAWPSVDGVRLFSQVTGDAVDLYMMGEQLANAKREAQRYVVFSEVFQTNPALTLAIQSLLQDGEVHAQLLSKGHRVSEPVPFRRWGEPP